MILVDANLLFYAYNRSSDHHEAAREWLETTISRGERIGFSWTVLLAFLRLATTPRVFPEPLSTTETSAIVSDWLARPNVAVVHPTERHWEILSSLLAVTRTRGKDVTDAHLAALAVEHGATFCTTDRDFARFPGLRTLDPLEG
ncbi:MAG TPA: type II toxin-antitoxin system VapC family toxin [Thermoanaerobaculia bacterium]|nr:type II toxin-antitoxin system VapC family toxin [Thermoanaerobaculia bacterium]